MTKVMSILALVTGIALLVVSAVYSGVDEARIRRSEENRRQYGALEDRIVADNAAIFTANSKLYEPDLSAEERARIKLAFAPQGQERDRESAILELGTHSSASEARALIGLHSQQSRDDLGLALGAGLFLLGLATIPKNLTAGLLQQAPAKVTS